MDCGFENLKRCVFCLICGNALEGAQGQRANGAVGAQALRRRRRARKRREWTRRVDVEGAIYWYRDTTLVAMLFQSVVLVYNAQKTGCETRHHALSAETVDASVTSDVIMAPNTPSDCQPTPSENIDPVIVSASELFHDAAITTTSLDEEISRVELSLVDPRHSQPLRFPITDSLDDQSSSTRKAELKQLIVDSSLPFPSKLAQFVSTTTATISPFIHVPSLHLSVHRADLYQESITLLVGLSTADIMKRLRIHFDKDIGVDAGGVYREWFLLVCEELVKPSTGVFRCVDAADQVFYLNPHSRHILGDNHLAHFFATGRFLGRALLEGNVTGFHLALPLLKIILGQPLSLSDLEFFDPETYRNLTWLLNNDGADALGLDFSVCEQVVMADGSTQTMVVDLIPNGRDVEVTDANKALFVDRKFRYMVFESVSSQLYALLKGVYEVVPPEMLMLFDAEELDYVLSGSDEIDVDDWERNSKWTFDLEDHPVRKWFWEIVRALPNEHRRRLLQFSTGSSRVPLAGFSALTSFDGRLSPFTLNGVSVSDLGYIHGHACFNRLDLPRYTCKHHLQLMLQVIVDGNASGFTTV
ncbi:hypothetical protein PINS_up015542 [Pythium insidiosum]|nr:hypothetical protein PINS_up015542 [Pythium insidiosum]